MRRILLALVAGMALAVPGVALAGGGGGGPCPGFAYGPLMSLEDNCFAGVAHFADAGEQLTVRNNGRWAHTFTSVDGLFDSGTLQYGETYGVPALEPGIYKLVCTLHGDNYGNGMTGVLIVGDPELTAAAATQVSAPPAQTPAAAPAEAPLVASAGSNVFPISLAAAALAVAIVALGASRRRPATPPTSL